MPYLLSGTPPERFQSSRDVFSTHVHLIYACYTIFLDEVAEGLRLASSMKCAASFPDLARASWLLRSKKEFTDIVDCFGYSN